MPPESDQGPDTDGSLHRLRAEKAQLEALLHALPDISFVLDRRGRYLQVIGGSDRSLYHDGKILEGQTLDDVLPPEVAARFRTVIEQAIDSGELQTVEYTLRAADVSALPEEERASARGRTDQWFQGRILPLSGFDHSEPCVLWVAINITERKRLEEELRRLATTDELTGVANRRTILAHAREEMARCTRYGHPLALLVLDVDHFKAVNDTYGHQAGDTILCRVAAACQAQLRQSDSLGRAGGEEFLAVLPETDRDGAAAIAGRLVAGLHSLDTGDAFPGLAVTVSVGGAWLEPGDSLDTLVARADDALYRAKAAGRDRFELPPDAGAGG